MLGQPVIKNVTVKSDEAEQRIFQSIQNCFLFADLDDEQLQDIILCMVERPVKEGDVVIKEGEDGDNIYVIEKGRYVASKDSAEIFEYDGCGAFGELALMYNCPRAATITALTDGVLWAVDRCSFRNVVIASMSERRQRHESILRKMHIFKDLSRGKLAVIADCLTRQTFAPGEIILHEGAPLNSNARFYIVEKGAVDCYKTFETERKLVKSIESGEFFGEVALISKQSRQADCIARSKTSVLSMARDAFERLMGPIDAVLHDRIQEYQALNDHFTQAV